MNLTHTPVSKLETSLADLEPIYQTIASAQARLIAKGSCLDGLYSVGILLQYITRLKETIGPWATRQAGVTSTLQHDYFAMKQRAQTAEYAARHVKHSALEIEVAKDERIIQLQNKYAEMQLRMQQAEAAANHAERALHKFMAEHNELKAERNKLVISLEDETDTVLRWKSRHELLQNEYQELDITCQKTEKKLEFAAALNAKLHEKNVGLYDELAEQEKQKLTLIRELAASEKYRHLLTKAILHTTPTEPAV